MDNLLTARKMPIPDAARFKEWACGRSLAGIGIVTHKLHGTQYHHSLKHTNDVILLIIFTNL
jgi:hypothetical protein